MQKMKRCEWNCGCSTVLSWVAQWYWSVTQTTGGRHVQHGDDLLLGLSQLGPLSRMAPQPHMLSDLCSSHWSVTTRTVQQLHNCGFGISVLTGTKSPHLVSSESDLLTPSRHALLRRRPSNFSCVPMLDARASAEETSGRRAWEVKTSHPSEPRP